MIIGWVVIFLAVLSIVFLGIYSKYKERPMKLSTKLIIGTDVLLIIASSLMMMGLI